MVRVKERYLLVNIIYPPEDSRAGNSSKPNLIVQHQPTTENLTPGILVRALKAQVASLFGDYGAGCLESDLSVKYLSLATSTVIIRCSRDHYQMLWSALTFMDRVPTKDGTGRPCIFRVVRVSGTIRKAEEEAIRQAKQRLIEAKEASSQTPSSLAPREPSHPDVILDAMDGSDDESMHDADD
ncbi:unnamed protein product [Clonostachys rosea]|uniref:Uncharacterized protein n=1 Tax=Bionectria ochroleuca TaxID=29856 RepID=A0ABY6TPT7_BIOOC|nr:unnamed protein product [Clonostachys rosea]